MEQFSDLVSGSKALVVYFSTPGCGVCTVLRPRVEELLAGRFPQIRFVYVDTTASPELPAQLSIFTVPTIVAFFEGREVLRKSRHFGLEELAAALERPYTLLFG